MKLERLGQGAHIGLEAVVVFFFFKEHRRKWERKRTKQTET